MQRAKRMFTQTSLVIVALMAFLSGSLLCQESHGSSSRDAIDKMRDRDLQPEKILDVIQLRDGMKAGEAGASYGYFTFKMSKRVGNKGLVFCQ